ncbi:hypothetical protein PsorP6_009787 [Peronosclerospora sorghi]|uniref:Uncharacterized protein n=1 Tax=Peronosclerospora sorghi TaxID=230839 RepID=A0ACC0W0B2_9STRA|nr:hypothetical protein PsorP6_009787 [Peronosclerospora sorghi]
MRFLLAAATVAVVQADEFFTGDGTSNTMHNLDGGNCNLMSTLEFATTNYAALNNAQWDGLHNCGRCAQVTCIDARCADHSKSMVVQLVDRCPECSYGDLDLSPNVFTALTGSSPSRYKIQWTFVTCPVSGNIKYCLKGGSNSFWTAIQPTNVATGVQSLKINGHDTTMVDSAYYYLLDGKSKIQTDLSRVAITLTDVNGHTIQDTVALKANSCTKGSKQFPSDGATQTSQSSPPAAKSPPPTLAPMTPPSPQSPPPTMAPMTPASPKSPPPTLAPMTPPSPQSPPPTLAPMTPPSPKSPPPTFAPWTFPPMQASTPSYATKSPQTRTKQSSSPTMLAPSISSFASPSPQQQDSSSPFAVPTSAIDTSAMDTVRSASSMPPTSAVSNPQKAPSTSDDSIVKQNPPLLANVPDRSRDTSSSPKAPPNLKTGTDMSRPTIAKDQPHATPPAAAPSTETLEQTDEDDPAQTANTRSFTTSSGTDPVIIILSTLGAVALVAAIVLIVIVKRKNIQEQKVRDATSPSVVSVPSFETDHTPSAQSHAFGVL